MGQLLALGLCCMPCALDLQPSGAQLLQLGAGLQQGSSVETRTHTASVAGSALACAAMQEYSAVHVQVRAVWRAAWAGTCCHTAVLAGAAVHC